jgi:hypothetical protein
VAVVVFGGQLPFDGDLKESRFDRFSVEVPANDRLLYGQGPGHIRTRILRTHQHPVAGEVWLALRD